MQHSLQIAVRWLWWLLVASVTLPRAKCRERISSQHLRTCSVHDTYRTVGERKPPKPPKPPKHRGKHGSWYSIVGARNTSRWGSSRVSVQHPKCENSAVRVNEAETGRTPREATTGGGRV